MKTSPKRGRRAAIAAPARPRTPSLLASGVRTLRLGSIPSTRSLLSATAMAFVGGMMLTTSVPANAVAATDVEPRASVYAPVEDTLRPAPQRMEVASEAQISVMAAESYAVVAAPPPILSQTASAGTFSLIETGAIVWPVTSIERRASGFGPRSAPCGGCSTYHDGVDFNPGAGTPVMSIADGVVVLATENGGGLGVNVEVQHNIGGQLITSSYAHMQYGSLTVAAGQRVAAGQQLGRIGSTGQSTGPHLHLEMFGTDGARFDGFAWLAAHVG